MQEIAGKRMQQWLLEYPILKHIRNKEEVMWINSEWLPVASALPTLPFTRSDVISAEERLVRFAPYLKQVFPETSAYGGLIESQVRSISNMREILKLEFEKGMTGKLFLKCDNALAISGSIKARGGIYEVLKLGERLAIESGLLQEDSDYTILAETQFRQLFSQYQIAVGSTGNLGLSIGIMGAAMGFRVVVHMSMDAKQWKKDKLRTLGVEVIEHTSDYTEAVDKGRREAERTPDVFFIDDENSSDLFFGYAVAASRLHAQLERLNVDVNQDSPLIVHLPCGVGGGPGGIAFGLKLLYGDNVHIFFAEPTHSPSMLLGLMTKEHDGVSVQDFGLDNKTAADGLAVGRPSRFVGRIMQHLIDGIYTVSDEKMYQLLSMLADTEGIAVEPSAAAGLFGPILLEGQLNSEGETRRHLQLKSKLNKANHLVWATGGNMVPEDIMTADYNKGKMLRQLQF